MCNLNQRHANESHEQLTTDEALGDQIAELAAHLHAATYRLLCLIREFDAQDGWADGFRSCADWLSWRVGYDLGTAREKVRVARTLADLPLISAAFGRGELSYAKVRAMTRIARPDNEQDLLDIAKAGTASHIEKVVRQCRRGAAADENEAAEQQYEDRWLSAYHDDQGMLVLQGRLPAELGEVVLKAIESAMNSSTCVLPDAENVSAETSSASAKPAQERVDHAASVANRATPTQRKADALVKMAESWLAHGESQRHQGEQTQVMVHVDQEVLVTPTSDGRSALGSGVRVSAETSRRLACDASVVKMTHDEQGNVLNVGRKTRKISPALRRALISRDGRCQFPGCDCNRWLDAHHVTHWANGGETKLNNLLLLCRFHHRTVHEGGFTIKLGAEGEVTVRRPEGRVLEQAPPSPTDVSAETFWAESRRHNRLIDADTLSVWNGDPMDLDWAVSAVI